MKAIDRIKPPFYRPEDLDKLDITHQQKWMLEREASAVFDAVSRDRVTFQEALAAVYLTGVLDAITLTNRQKK